MGLRRTITFPEKEMLDEIDRLQRVFDAIALEARHLEDQLEIAVKALDKIQNCDVEITDGRVIYYEPQDAVDLAILMASRALDEIHQL